MNDEKLDELERQIHDAIRFHREQYEKAIKPYIDQLVMIQTLRPRVMYLSTEGPKHFQFTELQNPTKW